MIRTGIVRGRRSTESSMPATSSITMRLGSFVPSTRSTREPAQMPSGRDHDEGGDEGRCA